MRIVGILSHIFTLVLGKYFDFAATEKQFEGFCCLRIGLCFAPYPTLLPSYSMTAQHCELPEVNVTIPKSSSCLLPLLSLNSGKEGMFCLFVCLIFDQRNLWFLFLRQHYSVQFRISCNLFYRPGWIQRDPFVSGSHVLGLKVSTTIRQLLKFLGIKNMYHFHQNISEE